MKKVFISADIEGCAGVISWQETELGSGEHSLAAQQMTQEVLAVCDVLIAQGVKEIVVKDAHDSGKNIFYDQLPEGVKIVRGWLGTPYSMVQGLDETFDAAIFIGYHGAASMLGNPLSHTMNLATQKIVVNDMVCSEYLLHAYAAEKFGVPVIMISGDQMICEWAESFNPNITTAPVKEGHGSGAISLNTRDSIKLIKEKTRLALQNNESCHIKIPEVFNVNITYRRHMDALKASYYPGVRRIDAYKVNFKAQSVDELMTTKMFIL